MKSSDLLIVNVPGLQSRLTELTIRYSLFFVGLFAVIEVTCIAEHITLERLMANKPYLSNKQNLNEKYFLLRCTCKYLFAVLYRPHTQTCDPYISVQDEK